MQSKKILIGSLLTLGLTAQCATDGDIFLQEKTTATTDVLKAVHESEDFDAALETWFVSFNKYQEQGDDMHRANEKALRDISTAREIK